MVIVTMIVVVVVVVVVVIVVVIVIVVVVVLPRHLCVVASLGIMVDTPIVDGALAGGWRRRVAGCMGGGFAVVVVEVYAKGPRVVVMASQLDDTEVPTPGDCQFRAIATCGPAQGLKVARPTIPPAQATTARPGDDDNDASGEPRTTTTTTWKTLR
ncbi:hypothetical protein EDB89DRAFT_1915092 [Lactarius sanguifluus]|nr:hypothetical protein EDB89DRAFT_1915092 [Lactarius sanguifluus]